MQPDDKLSLPFLTRKMLSFEHAVTFSLRIRSQSSVAGTITIRGFTREGIFTLKHLANGTGSVITQDFRLPDFPIMLSAIDSDEQWRQGECYITLSLVANDDILYDLGAGFPYAQKGVSWPDPGGLDARPAGGAIKVIAGADPAAGAEVSFTVPTGRAWRILAFNVRLVTAATAGSRRVHLVFSSASSSVFNAFSTVDQIISENKEYTAGVFGEITDETDDNDILIPIPAGIFLHVGDLVTTETLNLAAGDNYAAPKLMVEEFFEPF